MRAKPVRPTTVHRFPAGNGDEASAAMTKDAKDNRRGCFIVGALVAILLAALAWGIAGTDEDPRSNGIVTPGAAPQAPAPAPSEPKADPTG